MFIVSKSCSGFQTLKRIISGDVVKDETYAFVYRRHSSSKLSPFKLPYSYNLVWDSSGSRNKNAQKIRVWSLNCPPDYVALGYVTTVAPAFPEKGAIYCVRRYFVELGNLIGQEQPVGQVWASIWDSNTFKSNQMAKFYEQKPSNNPDHLSPEGFAAVGQTAADWNLPNPAYYFQKLHVDFYDQVPVMEQWIKDRL